MVREQTPVGFQQDVLVTYDSRNRQHIVEACCVSMRDSRSHVQGREGIADVYRWWIPDTDFTPQFCKEVKPI